MNENTEKIDEILINKPPKGLAIFALVGPSIIWCAEYIGSCTCVFGMEGIVPYSAERSEHYKNYVQGALRNPAVVGTHWFQFRDQATTGRGDGENYQIGFLDVCDKPLL